MQLVRAWEPVVDLLRLGCFLAFVGLGVWVARRGRRPAHPGAARGATNVFLLFVLSVSTVVGLVQRESWPFTTWALIHNASPDRMNSWLIQGLDANGRAYPIDPRVLQPLAPEDFGAWMSVRLGQLPASGQERVARFVLDRAEEGRMRLLKGDRVGRNEWLFGPVTAPSHFHQPRFWRTIDDVPATPFTGFRLWRLEWNLEARFRDEENVSRTLFLEIRPRPTT